MRRLLILIVFTLMSCFNEDHVSQKTLPNELPEAGELIQFDEAEGFSNLDTVRAGLSEDQKSTFDVSLGWYATEADHELERLRGKSAHEAVDIVNCLKVKSLEEEGFCFE